MEIRMADLDNNKANISKAASSKQVTPDRPATVEIEPLRLFLNRGGARNFRIFEWLPEDHEKAMAAFAERHIKPRNPELTESYAPITLLKVTRWTAKLTVAATKKLSDAGLVTHEYLLNQAHSRTNNSTEAPGSETERNRNASLDFSTFYWFLHWLSHR